MVRTVENVFYWNLERRSPNTAPPPACCHTLCNVENRKLILFGGGVWGHVYKDVYSFDVDRSRWQREETQDDDLVSPRMSHSAVVIGNRMLVYGGMDLQLTFGDLLELDLATMRWSVVCNGEDAGPGPRRSHAAVAYHNTMYVVMGHPSRRAGEVWSFDTTQRKWDLLQSSGLFGGPPQPLFGHSAAVSGDYIYVFGGVATTAGHADLSTARYTNQLYRFHIPSQRWSEIGTTSRIAPAPRYSHVMGLSGNLLIVHGGDANQCSTYFDDMWSIDVSSPQPVWVTHRTGPLTPTKRSGHAGVVVKGVLVVFGGETPGVQQPSGESVAYSGATFQIPIGLPVAVSLTDLCARWLSTAVNCTEVNDFLCILTQSARDCLMRHYPLGSKEVIAWDHCY